MSRPLFFIVLLALFVRVFFFSLAAVSSDGNTEKMLPHFDGYYEIAENLLAGRGFSQDTTPPFAPTYERTPLYPFFIAGLAFFFKSYYAALIAQILLGSVLPLLGYRIALQLLGDARGALFVALALALEPFTIFLATTMVSETLFAFLFLASITLFLDYLHEGRAHTLAQAGLFLGLATLTRPTTQYLVLVFVVIIVWIVRKDRARAVRHSLIVATAFFFVISPWLLRNFLLARIVALTTQPASILYSHFTPSVIALEQNIGFEDARQKFFAEEQSHGAGKEVTPANASYYKNRAMTLLAPHPVGILKSIGMTAFTFFTHDGYWDVVQRVGYASDLRFERPFFIQLLQSPSHMLALLRPLLSGPVLLVIAGRLVWTLIALSFVWGAIHYLRTEQNRAKGILALLIIIYFVLTTAIVGFGVNARYRMPVNALILSFAVYGATTLLPKRRISCSTIKEFILFVLRKA